MPGPGSKASPKPQRIIDKVRNHIRRRQTVSDEQRIMQAVRREDRYCRFPLCCCGKMKLKLEVAHAGDDGHRGMGGNSSLSRTTPENLILLCRPRHRAHQFSIDKHTLRIEPVTDRGLRGPVEWWIDAEALPLDVMIDLGIVVRPERGTQLLLAVETSPHQFLPFTPDQSVILKALAQMDC